MNIQKLNKRPLQDSLVFGFQSVLETLRAGKAVDKIFMQKGNGERFREIAQIANKNYVPISRVPIEKLNRITRKNHQGIIAFTAPITFANLFNTIQSVFEQGESPLVLILDNITDVRNFGAICRTAEASGVHAIVVPTKGAASINSEALKTSSGALNFISVCREPKLQNTVQFLKDSGLQIVACTEKTDTQIYDIDFKTPTAIILGSEEGGVSADLLKSARHLSKIPMFGQVESLNVSVATGVILYEAVRQRQV